MLFIVLVLVALAVFLSSQQDDEIDLAPDRDTVEVALDKQRKLAEQYRPILLFDSRESWRPLNVDRFFDESGTPPHRLCRRQENPRSCPPILGYGAFLESVSQAGQGGADRFINIGGEGANGTDSEGPRSDCPERAPPLQDCNGGPGTAIYYNVKQANGRYYVDYWWFFRYNDFRRIQSAASCTAKLRPLCGDHEGDWEGITVVTSADKPGEIEYVTYAEHSGDFRYARSQISVGGRDDSRPFVFVADGTHASYASECTGEGCTQLFPIALGLRRPEGRHDGKVSWGRNTGEDCSEGSPTCLIHVPDPDSESWNAFGGLWGLVCSGGGRDCPVNPGPQTPSRQDRYRFPWCYQRVLPSGKGFERAASCDVQSPVGDPAGAPGLPTQTDCRAWAGSQVAILACDATRLAAGLADDTASESSGIAIELNGDAVGKTVTRGVSQVVDKPVRPPSVIRVRGRVTEVIVRARAPDERLVEAKFPGLALGPADEAEVAVRDVDGQLRLSLRLPDGSFVEPTLTTLG